MVWLFLLAIRLKTTTYTWCRYRLVQAWATRRLLGNPRQDGRKANSGRELAFTLGRSVLGCGFLLVVSGAVSVSVHKSKTFGLQQLGRQNCGLHVCMWAYLYFSHKPHETETFMKTIVNM